MKVKADRIIKPRGVFAVVLALLGLAFVWGGIKLLVLGGSAYYVVSGLTLCASALLLWKGDRRGLWTYALLMIATSIWALHEVGLSSWGLLSRLGLFAALTCWLLWSWIREVRVIEAGRAAHIAVSSALGAAVLGLIGPLAVSGVLRNSDAAVPAETTHARSLSPGTPDPGSAAEWHHYARDLTGNRYVPVTQITKDNVRELRLAWSFRTGDMPANKFFSFEGTPLKIGGKLVICTPSRQVVALEPDSGKQIWRFAPKFDGMPGQVGHTCRGVSYHHSMDFSGPCADRILLTTRDDFLYALDLETGQTCPDFGANGRVSLLDGIGPLRENARDTFPTSPGLVLGDKIVLGAFVVDAQRMKVPSGVIRAFDVHSGKLVWAWDMGRPDDIGPPLPGEVYTPSTPNAWPPFSADPALNLIYVPLGNPSPDFYGKERRPYDEKYGTALVALDANTGRAKWSFQAVHHDLWDLDIPAQPILLDLKMSDGVKPAVVQLTKTGDVFVLDRRTGAPLVPVNEVPVPQKGAVPEERLSPTQPMSALSLAPHQLKESDMWGLTPLDQMACRIQFKEQRYEGLYTPPGTDSSIGYPAMGGTFSWGSGTVDVERGLLVANVTYMPFLSRLIPRKLNGEVEISSDYPIDQPMLGAPYSWFTRPMLSALGIPCKVPPIGELVAVDLASSHIVWRHVLGTSRANGPFGIPSLLPLPTGTPSAGGTVMTSAGLVFIGATTDRYLRAFDVDTGRELWRASLPAAANATPITYVSERTHRQYVVIAAGGHVGFDSTRGDYVMAYALPDK